MNDHLLAVELAAVLNSAAYAAFNTLVPHIHPAQAAAVTTRPTLGITGEYAPYFQRRKGTVRIELRSRVGDETVAGEQQVRFLALFTALLGAPGADNAATRASLATAKAVLKAAVLARGKVEIVEYGPAADAVVADVDGEDLRTVLTLAVIWRFIPV